MIKNKNFYKISVWVSIIFLLVLIIVYVIFEDELIFAPDLFINEGIKILSITFIWSIILNFFRTKDQSQTINTKISNLILNPTSKILLKETSYNTKELSLDIGTLSNNLLLLINSSELDPMTIEQLTTYYTKFSSTTTQEDLNNIEYLIENGLDYEQTEYYERILNLTKQLYHVFANKK